MNTLTKPDNKVESEANGNYLSPPVDIYETKDAYVLDADMPGVGKSGLEVLLEGNELTLVGRRLPKTPPGDLVYGESKPWEFRRTFELDPSIDAAKITAHIDQGLLRLSLPKAERLKPRRIVVTD